MRRKRGRPDMETLRATWASYEGQLRHAQAHRLRINIWKQHPVSLKLLHFIPRAKRRFAVPGPAPSLRAQIVSLRQGLGGALLLVRVGRYVRLSRFAAKKLGLRPMPWKKQKVFLCGIHRKYLPWLVQQALSKGLTTAIALEEPRLAGNVKMRRLAWIIEPHNSPLNAGNEKERR
jgi:hypothetical protein